MEGGALTSSTARRRRGAELENALLDAAWDELLAVGYPSLQMEAVAARAATGKQVLYRRWRNRAELVIAAAARKSGSIVDPVPDTGTLRGDVFEIMQRMTGRFHNLGPAVFRGLMAEASEVEPHFRQTMNSVIRELMVRAQDRGEIPQRPLDPRIVALPADLVRIEMLYSPERVSDEVLIEILDNVYLPLVLGNYIDPSK